MVSYFFTKEVNNRLLCYVNHVYVLSVLCPWRWYVCFCAPGPLTSPVRLCVDNSSVSTPGNRRRDAELEDGRQWNESPDQLGRLRSNRITEIGLMFTSLSLLLALALLILSWLAGTADACPLWAEDSRAPGPASLTPSRPIVLRRLRWKGADTPPPLGNQHAPMLAQEGTSDAMLQHLPRWQGPHPC